MKDVPLPLTFSCARSAADRCGSLPRSTHPTPRVPSSRALPFPRAAPRSRPRGAWQTTLSRRRSPRATSSRSPPSASRRPPGAASAPSLRIIRPHRGRGSPVLASRRKPAPARSRSPGSLAAPARPLEIPAIEGRLSPGDCQTNLEMSDSLQSRNVGSAGLSSLPGKSTATTGRSRCGRSRSEKRAVASPPWTST